MKTPTPQSSEGNFRSRVFKIAGAVEVALLIGEALLGAWLPWLPLGGTHIGQLGVALGVAFILDEVLPKSRG